MHRAVVEATHFRNVPLAHLEASQYKNNLVSTALTRGKKAITQEKGEIWQCERPVSNSHGKKFGTNSPFSRCQQHALPVLSKDARPHAIRVSRQCAAEGQWMGRICENECPIFVCVLVYMVRCPLAMHATDETAASK